MITTKEQERKALEKIREIVAGLGDDSYVGTALTGCLEDAEENIECDFALSMKDRYETAQRNLENTKAETARLSEQIDSLIEKAIEANDRAERAEGMYNTEQRIADDLRAKWHEAEEDLDQARGRIARLETEIVGLKAKLYDMMTAGA